MNIWGQFVVKGYDSQTLYTMVHANTHKFTVPETVINEEIHNTSCPMFMYDSNVA